MGLSKMLSPSFWIDMIVTFTLQAALAVLVRILYVIKGEDIRVNKEVTSRHISEKSTTEKIPKNQQKPRAIPKATRDSKTVNFVTGIPSELKSEKVINKTVVFTESPIETILRDELIKEEIETITHEGKPQEKEEIACPNEMRTAHGITEESDMIPIEFHWKHGGNKVFVTGDFDGWKAQKHEMNLNPGTNEFVAVVEIDRTKHHDFKFVVDGNWQCNWDFPTRHDEHGNVNNILYPNPIGPLNLESSFPSQMTTTAY